MNNMYKQHGIMLLSLALLITFVFFLCWVSEKISDKTGLDLLFVAMFVILVIPLSFFGLILIFI